MRIDSIFHSGQVITMDQRRPRASAIGVLNGRIVGLDDDLAGATADEVVDLRGTTVLPGFHDAHCHTVWFGLGLQEIDLDGAATDDEVSDRLAVGAGTGEWIVGTGLNHFRFAGRYPSIGRLDAVAQGRPLVVKLTSGHGVLANSEALRRAGVFAPGFSGVPGGRVVTGEDGRPAGLLEETAQALVLDLVKPYSLQSMVQAIDAATSTYVRQGITSFTEAGVGDGMIGHSPVELAAYHQAREAGVLRARARVMPTLATLSALGGHPADPVGRGLPLGIRTGFGDDHLALAHVKLFVDGAISAHTAAMHGHYHGSTDSGYLALDPEELVRTARELAGAGWSLAVHAIGDAAVDVAMDAIAAALEVQARPAAPHRIEHAGMVSDGQLVRLAALGVVVTPQASFFGTNGDTMVEAIGEDRVPLLYRGRSFTEAGVRVAGSSDRPCAIGDPLYGIARSMDRRTASGRQVGPDHERLTFLEALELYTVGSAHAVGVEDRLGRLAPGMLADMTVLERSPLGLEPVDVERLRVTRTVVGGRTVHQT